MGRPSRFAFEPLGRVIERFVRSWERTGSRRQTASGLHPSKLLNRRNFSLHRRGLAEFLGLLQFLRHLLSPYRLACTSIEKQRGCRKPAAASASRHCNYWRPCFSGMVFASFLAFLSFFAIFFFPPGRS